jgi:hypothetical protein
VAIAAFVLFLSYALINWARVRSPVMLLIAIGGLIAALLEPFWGVLGLLNYRAGSMMSFTLFNTREIPVFCTLLYSIYAGGTAYLFYKIVSAESTQKQFWTGIGMVFALNLTIEIPLTGLHLYDYYGAQPFQFYEGGFPLWWLFTNLGGIASGTILAKAVQRFGPRAAWIALPLIPSAFGAWEVWAGWPTFFALNYGGGLVMTYAAAFVTIGLAVATAWGIAYAALPRTSNSGAAADTVSKQAARAA